MINNKETDGLSKLNCNQCHSMCRDKMGETSEKSTNNNQKHARRLRHAVWIRKSGTEHRHVFWRLRPKEENQRIGNSFTHTNSISNDISINVQRTNKNDV